MKRWASLIGALLIAGALSWWVLQVELLSAGQRSDASGYGQFVLAAVGLMIIVGQAVWKAFAKPTSVDLDAQSDLLAATMRNQWLATAIERGLVAPAPLPLRWRRATDPIAGPISAATAARDGQGWFEPLPGLARATASTVRNGTRKTLHAVYGGLPSGRLLITGGPGAGKSSAAVLLLLDALRFRDQTADGDARRRVPVPVMFTLHSWQPEKSGLQDWLVTKLVEIPLFRGLGGARRARDLLLAGRVSVFLDGLDEVSEAQRPLALRALSEQTTCRLVLLTRGRELADAARQHGLIGAAAIELQPLSAGSAAKYLLDPLTEPAPTPWQRVTEVLVQQPDSVFARALSTPFSVSLIRDIYMPGAVDEPEVDELLDHSRFPTPEDVTNHLLERAITVAYTARPGQQPSRYSPETARRTLTYLARQLTKQGTRDFAWWEIDTWVPSLVRRLVFAAPTALALGLLVTIFFTLVTKIQTGVVDGIVTAVIFGGALMLSAGKPGRLTPSRINLSMKYSRTVPQFKLALVLAVLTTVTIWILVEPYYGLLSASTSALTLFLIVPQRGDGASTSPTETWYNDLKAGIAITVTVGVTICAAEVLLDGGGFISGRVHGLVNNILFGLAVGQVGGAILGFLLGTQVFSIALFQAYLAIRHRTPLRLLRFVEDARSRQLVRTVGGVYQFRHATLQDRLCEE